ncbi:MAG: UPF0182 family protein [Nocardioides sp.]
MSELFDDENPRATQVDESPRAGRSRALIITGFILAICFLGFTGFSSLWTEKLWFNSVGYENVFTTQLVTRVGLFGVFASVMALSLASTMYLAHRFRPFVVPTSVQRDSLDRYREILTPMRRSLLLGISALIGIFAGSSASGQWRIYQLWRNSVDFNQVDPYFRRDLSFYVFDLAWLHFLVDFAMAITVVCLIASALVHYLYGGIQLQSRHDRFSDAAQVQLSALVGIFVLFKAIDYWLSRFDLVSDGGALVTGMTYTRDNAELPARNILMSIAVICAVLFLVNVWFRTWMLPSVGLALLVLSAILLGMLWPALVQQFQVAPTEADKEQPYIARNIEATRAAYALKDAVVEPYAGNPTLADNELATAAINNPGIRLVDPQLVQQTFEQKQQVRGYYSVAPVLDVDRYDIKGQERDLVLGVRELDQQGLPDDSKNWANLRTVYTHGYGVIAAYGNQRPADDGDQVTGDEPAWAETDIPPKGDLTDLGGDGYEGRIYFGENSPEYSVVGKTSADADDIEYDLPGGEDGDSGGDRTTTYDGAAGVPVGNLLNKVLYAMRFGDANLILSGRVHENSKILYDRNPRLMVEKVAPWLTVDEDPFPAVVDGRVVWMLDGFTTTDRYPLSQKGSYAAMTRDALAPTSPQFQTLPTDEINYMRNAVKATVDAYDGTVRLYAWDEQDPILQTWMKAFPGTVLPKSSIPDGLLQHMRYPEDLFKVQRFMFARYHVTDADDFYKQNDQWDVPKDPNQGASLQPPYRLSVQTPSGGNTPTFSLTSVYVPSKRQNLAAFLSVDADASQDSYGTMRVLRLGSSTQIPGPGQIANQIGSDEEVKRVLLPFTNNATATVLSGNLLTLPVGGGLLYVQPLYTQRTTGDGNYPVLRFVAVSFGDKVGVGTTLSEAIFSLLDIDPDAEPTPTKPPATDPGPGTDPGGKPDKQPTGSPEAQIRALLADADALFAEADAALKAGNLGTYEAKVNAARAKIDKALTIAQQNPG